MQKPKFSEWTHRHTRADDVVAQIMDHVHDANGANGAVEPAAAPAS